METQQWSFRDALSETSIGIRTFSTLSGINLCTVRGWAKGKAIPAALEPRVKHALDRSVIERVAANLEKPVRDVQKMALAGIHTGHRASKSGKYVGPDGRPFGGPFSGSGLFFSVYVNVFDTEDWKFG